MPTRPIVTAEYVPGPGWMYVTKNGRFGNYDTEVQALSAGSNAAGI